MSKFDMNDAGDAEEFVDKNRCKTMIEVRLPRLSDGIDLVSAFHMLMDPETDDKDEALAAVGQILRKGILHRVESNKVK